MTAGEGGSATQGHGRDSHAAGPGPRGRAGDGGTPIIETTSMTGLMAVRRAVSSAASV